MANQKEKKEKKSAEKVEPAKKVVKKEEPVLSPEEICRNDIEECVLALIGAVQKKDWSALARVIRRGYGIRKRISPFLMKETVVKYYGDIVDKLDCVDCSKKEVEAMDTAEDKDEKEKPKEPPKPTKEQIAQAKAKEELMKSGMELPELKVWVHLLVISFLIDQEKHQEAVQGATSCFEFVQGFNRRTMDQLSENVYHLYSLTHEHVGKLSSIRNSLLLAHRSAALQHNEHGQAALTVAILRNYLEYNLVTQADKFRLTTNFPEARSSNLFARYCFYTGRINAIQLSYSQAFANLSQAIRRAPQTSALGFRTQATKLCIIVQLLMGEIPERNVFLQNDMVKPLEPYFNLTQAVRVGDLVAFGAHVEAGSAVWEQDRVFSLITRLRNNVIKTGLRKINLSYSRISIEDICNKLNLGSGESAEHIVAKAIHDGVIDAVIDREQKFLYSTANVDVYSTMQPQDAFHKRVQFCMDIHNDAVKALRYPPDAHKPQKDQVLIEADLDEVDLSDDDLDL